MGYADYLKGLLHPLGIYSLEGSVNGCELEAVGAELDLGAVQLTDCQREMLLCTAEGEGLSLFASLLLHKPVEYDLDHLRAALQALLRIGDDSFTVEAINDNIRGCGLNALVQECEEPQTVQVSFPEVPGIPDDFEQLSQVIEDILPCHLKIEYHFWYLSWAQLEEKISCWAEIEEKNLDWEHLEKYVE